MTNRDRGSRVSLRGLVVAREKVTERPNPVVPVEERIVRIERDAVCDELDTPSRVMAVDERNSAEEMGERKAGVQVDCLLSGAEGGVEPFRRKVDHGVGHMTLGVVGVQLDGASRRCTRLVQRRGRVVDPQQPGVEEMDPTEHSVGVGIFGVQVDGPLEMAACLGIGCLGDLGRRCPAALNVIPCIEAIADPGGISVTDAVHDVLLGDFEFRDDGQHELKGLPQPIRVWKVRLESDPASRGAEPLPRKLATIAVLAFENLSDDVDQEYFADGIAEDLLGTLSLDRELAVVPRSSSFAYKGTSVDVRLVARELDATHIVQGTVRKAGGRLRLTAQLVDAESGITLWSEKHDRPQGDVFDLQDELVEAMTTRIRPSLRDAVGRARVKRPGLDAWDLTVRGQFHMNTFTLEGLRSSVELFDEAMKLDSSFATPVGLWSGARLALLLMYRWSSPGVNTTDQALSEARTAYRLDPENHVSRTAMAFAETFTGNPTDGMRHARWMIDANPHAPIGHHVLGFSLYSTDSPLEAVESLSRAWRLGSHDPFRFDVANDLAWAHYAAGGLDAALAWAHQGLQLHSHLQAHYVAASVLGLLDRVSEAGIHVEAINSAYPEFSAELLRSRLTFRDPAVRERLVDGLVRAGLPR